MALEELISLGESVRKTCAKKSAYGISEFLSGEDYEKWIAQGIMYMEKNHKDSPLFDRFMEASKTASGSDVSHYDVMMGILKAIKDYD